MATLDAKFMNAFFAANKLDVERFRVEESNTMSNKYYHRYFSFIQSRVLCGVKIVDLCEQLMNSPSVRELWERYGLYDLVSPIEDVSVGIWSNK